MTESNAGSKNAVTIFPSVNSIVIAPATDGLFAEVFWSFPQL